MGIVVNVAKTEVKVYKASKFKTPSRLALDHFYGPVAA